MQMAGWPVWATDKWRDIGHLIYLHASVVLNSELLETNFNIVRHTFVLKKHFIIMEGNFFKQKWRHEALNRMDSVNSFLN